MVAHRRGREKARESLGWKGGRAKWLALVCFHSGVFTRTPAAPVLEAHPKQVRRRVLALLAHGLRGGADCAKEHIPSTIRYMSLRIVRGAQSPRAVGTDDSAW